MFSIYPLAVSFSHKTTECAVGVRAVTHISYETTAVHLIRTPNQKPHMRCILRCNLMAIRVIALDMICRVRVPGVLGNGFIRVTQGDKEDKGTVSLS